MTPTNILLRWSSLQLSFATDGKDGSGGSKLVNTGPLFLSLSSEIVFLKKFTKNLIQSAFLAENSYDMLPLFNVSKRHIVWQLY